MMSYPVQKRDSKTMPHSFNSFSFWRRGVIPNKVYTCCFINTHTRFDPIARNYRYDIVEEVHGKWNLTRERTHRIRLDPPIKPYRVGNSEFACGAETVGSHDESFRDL